MLTITHIWKCDLCPKTAVEARTLEYRGLQECFLPIPMGWHRINGKLVCDEHEVVIDPPKPEKKPPNSTLTLGAARG